jgi:hypothetical protein
VSEVRLTIWRLTQDEENHIVVCLRDDQWRPLLIAIGACEAAAIYRKLAPPGAVKEPLRPMTHDLLNTLLGRLDASLQRVVIDDLWRQTYYAKLHVISDGQTLAIDARPSDAIALALRAGAPIYATEEVMQSAATLDTSEAEEGEGETT